MCQDTVTCPNTVTCHSIVVYAFVYIIVIPVGEYLDVFNHVWYLVRT